MWHGVVDHHPADQIPYYHKTDHSVRNAAGEIYDWGARTYLYGFDAVTHEKMMLFKDYEARRRFFAMFHATSGPTAGPEAVDG